MPKIQLLRILAVSFTCFALAPADAEQRALSFVPHKDAAREFGMKFAGREETS
jgi:hypothetical protein